MNTQFAKGYRTYIVGAILVLYAVATETGVEIPEPGGAGGLGLGGLLMLLFRRITSTPAPPTVSLLKRKGGE